MTCDAESEAEAPAPQEYIIAPIYTPDPTDTNAPTLTPIPSSGGVSAPSSAPSGSGSANAAGTGTGVRAPPPPSSSSSSVPLGAIIGGAVGGVVLIVGARVCWAQAPGLLGAVHAVQLAREASKCSSPSGTLCLPVPDHSRTLLTAQP